MTPVLNALKGDTESAGVAFRDVLFLMVLSLVIVIFLISLLINPQEEEEAPLRTDIVIEAMWPSGEAHDIDLWAMGPDEVPVGWGLSSAGPSLNLERDDRGIINDATTLNYEIITVRDKTPGEYLINLHLYNEFESVLPVPVTVKVTGRGGLGEIFSGEVRINERKQEVTVVRFRLDEDGNLVEDSINDMFKCILCRRG